MNKRPVSIKANIFYNSAGAIVYLCCQWLMTVFVVSFSGYEDAGRLSLAMSISNSFVCISLYGTRSYQVSDLTPRFNDGIYISTRIITCVIGYVSCVVFAGVNGYSLNQFLCIVLFMGLKTAEAAVDVYHGIDQKAWRMDIVGTSFFIRGIASLGLYTLVIWTTRDLSLSIAAAALISFVILLVFDLPKAKTLSNYKLHFDLRENKTLLITCLPLAVYSFIITLIPLVPRYFLQQIYGDTILGIYASVATPTIVIQAVSAFIFNPLITLFAQHFKERNQKAFVSVFLKCLWVIIAVSAVSIVGALFIGKWGLIILFGRSIAEYTYLLIPIIICTILMTFVWFIGTILTVIRDIKGLIIGNLLGLAICFALSPVLISHLSMNGVNIALIIPLSLESVFLLLRGRYILRKSMA